MVVKENILKVTKGVKSRVLESPPVRRLVRSNWATVLRTRVLELAYLAVIFTLTAGLVNSILEGSKSQYSGQLFTTDLSVQTVNEVVFNFFNLILGTAGIYMIYLGARTSPRMRLSALYIVFGFSAVIIAILVGMYLLWLKGF